MWKQTASHTQWAPELCGNCVSACLGFLFCPFSSLFAAFLRSYLPLYSVCSILEFKPLIFQVLGFWCLFIVGSFVFQGWYCCFFRVGLGSIGIGLGLLWVYLMSVQGLFKYWLGLVQGCFTVGLWIVYGWFRVVQGWFKVQSWFRLYCGFIQGRFGGFKNWFRFHCFRVLPSCLRVLRFVKTVSSRLTQMQTGTNLMCSTGGFATFLAGGAALGKVQHLAHIWSVVGIAFSWFRQ